MAHTCVFCKIIHGELPASVVFDSADVLAIMDIQPINPGHVLVMPKICFSSLREMPAELSLKVFEVVKQVEQAIWHAEGLACEGTNILQNNGRSAWQDVFHVHFHVVPRFSGDAFKIKYPANHPGRAELDDISQRIKQGLDKSS